MEKDEKTITDLDSETGVTDLMKAHLDDVAGGASHNSWRQNHVAPTEE